MGTPTLSYLALWYKWSVRMSEEHKEKVRFFWEPQNSGTIVSVLPPPLQMYTGAVDVAQLVEQ